MENVDSRLSFLEAALRDTQKDALTAQKERDRQAYRDKSRERERERDREREYFAARERLEREPDRQRRDYETSGIREKKKKKRIIQENERDSRPSTLPEIGGG